ncbi:MAG: ABC transporter permease [Candidatus Binataceae bacterium]
MIFIRYNARSLWARSTTSLMTALGIALVIALVFLLLGFIAGLRQTFQIAAAKDNWVLLSRGVASEPASYVSHEAYEILRVRPEVATDFQNESLISPEGVLSVDVAPIGHRSRYTVLRGVTPMAYLVHPHMHLVSGHWPQTGQNQWVIGQQLLAKFPDLAPPRTFRFGHRTWSIVGVFSDEGSSRESEILTDLNDLKADAKESFPPGSISNSLHLVLKPGMANSFIHVLNKDARLTVDATSEVEFYSAEASFSNSLRSLGLIVAAILAVGAAFGGMNTMYSAVARRSREVGVLRALGFNRSAVLFSFLLESIILGAVGGLIGELAAVAVLYLSGFDHRLMSAGLLVFTFRLSTTAIITGLLVALGIGALGGILPAVHAAYIPILRSLREE